MLYLLSYVLSYLLDLAAILRIKISALDIENIERRVNMFSPPPMLNFTIPFLL